MAASSLQIVLPMCRIRLLDEKTQRYKKNLVATVGKDNDCTIHSAIPGLEPRDLISRSFWLRYLVENEIFSPTIVTVRTTDAKNYVIVLGFCVNLEDEEKISVASCTACNMIHSRAPKKPKVAHQSTLNAHLNHSTANTDGIYYICGWCILTGKKKLFHSGHTFKKSKTATAENNSKLHKVPNLIKKHFDSSGESHTWLFHVENILATNPIVLFGAALQQLVYEKTDMRNAIANLHPSLAGNLLQNLTAVVEVLNPAYEPQNQTQIQTQIQTQNQTQIQTNNLQVAYNPGPNTASEITAFHLRASKLYQNLVAERGEADNTAYGS